MYNAGLIVITAFISPYRADRDRVRALFQPGQFWEVFISCPLEICKQRDPKGLYQLALAGEIAEFTGVSSPYEEPPAPELVIHSGEQPVEVCVDEIVRHMIEEKIIKKPD
jgi:adenylylsulfate kinase